MELNANGADLLSGHFSYCAYHPRPWRGVPFLARELAFSSHDVD